MDLLDNLDKQINRLERLQAQQHILAVVISPEAFNSLVRELGAEVLGNQERYFWYRGYAIYAHHKCTVRSAVYPYFDRAKVS